MGEESKSRVEIRYADERTRESYEIAAKVNYLKQKLLTDELPAYYEYITFDEEHSRRGITALFFAGAEFDIEREGVFLATEQDKQILQELGIPYKFVENDSQ